MPLVHIRQIPLVARASVAEHLLRVSGKSGVERSIGLLGPALLWLFLPEFRPLPSTADGGSSEKQPVQEVQRLGFLTVLVLVMAPILCRIPHRRHDGSRVHERQVVQVANGARDGVVPVDDGRIPPIPVSGLALHHIADRVVVRLPDNPRPSGVAVPPRSTTGPRPRALARTPRRASGTSAASQRPTARFRRRPWCSSARPVRRYANCQTRRRASPRSLPPWPRLPGGSRSFCSARWRGWHPQSTRWGSG